MLPNRSEYSCTRRDVEPDLGGPRRWSLYFYRDQRALINPGQQARATSALRQWSSISTANPQIAAREKRRTASEGPGDPRPNRSYLGTCRTFPVQRMPSLYRTGLNHGEAERGHTRRAEEYHDPTPTGRTSAKADPSLVRRCPFLSPRWMYSYLSRRVV